MATAGRTGNEDPGGWKEGRVPARGAGRVRRQAVAGALSAAGLVAAALSLALVLAAPAGSAGATTTTGKTVKVSTATVTGVGTVLTTASGLTLYRFTEDSPGVSKCTGACAKIWPPLLAVKGVHVSGPHGVKGLSLLSVGNGHWQVAFHKLPLYRFEGDKKKGQAHGQNVGGVWFAVLKSGIPATAIGGCPRRDVDHGAGRVDDATDDVDDARFALGHGIELRVELDRTHPDAGHAGDDATHLTADDATHLTATHLTVAHHDHLATATATTTATTDDDDHRSARVEGPGSRGPARAGAHRVRRVPRPVGCRWAPATRQVAAMPTIGALR